MKQTAVELLYVHLLPFLNFSDVKEREYFRKCLEEAKDMEKEQIKEAFDEGQEYEYQYHINNAPKFDSETYYNETYERHN